MSSEIIPSPEVKIIDVPTARELHPRIWEEVSQMGQKTDYALRIEDPKVIQQALGKDGMSWECLVAGLEKRGFTISAGIDANPYGVFVGETQTNGHLIGEGIEGQLPNHLQIQHLGRSVLSRAPEKADIKIPGLNGIITHGMSIALHNGKSKWESPVMTPGGEIAIQGADSTFSQYAQTVFEGMVAIKQPDGTVVLFRPEENARRLAESARAFNLPALPTEQFLQMVRSAVLQNLHYAPDGHEGRLYIRPWIGGTEGGAGASSARNAIAAVEVFPFGDYKKAEGMSVRAIKNVSRPPMGRHKGAVNYAPFFNLKAQLQAAEKPDSDYLSFDENGFLEEASTACVFVVVEGPEGLELHTPFVGNENHPTDPTPHKRNSLPSITRKSVIELAKNMGISALRRDIPYRELAENPKIKGVFTVGTAMGLTPVKQIGFTKNPEDPVEETRVFEEKQGQRLIAHLKDQLSKARMGMLEDNLAHLNQEWAMRLK